MMMNQDAPKGRGLTAMNVKQLFVFCMGIAGLVVAWLCPPIDYENMGGFTRFAYRYGRHVGDTVNVNMGWLCLVWLAILIVTAILIFLLKDRKPAN